MGYSSSGGPNGLGVITDSNTPLSDLTKLIELIGRVGNMRVETTTTRDAISGGALYDGLGVYNTTLDAYQVYNGTGWVTVWAAAGAPGSITPTPAASYTLSSGALFLRNGFLLGSISFARTSGTLTHGEAVMTLPVGARPAHEYNTGALFTLAANPSMMWQVRVQTTGVVQIVDPPAGRTGGVVSFVVPV